MNGQDSQAEIFDVFLSYNSEDKPAVREIAQRLVKEGIKPWLDVEQVPPGTSWQTVLGEQINRIKSAAVFVGNSGIGPWQNEEIQAFLSQFMQRGCPVIPTILASATATPELPWTLKNRHHVDFRVSDLDPLKQLIWGITRQKPAAREPLIPGKDDLAVSRRTPFEERLYPLLAHPPDQDQISQLKILGRRVNEYWIDGVLRHSLHNEVLISLGKREIGGAVDAPWKYTVEVSDALNPASLEDKDVSAIYDSTGLLLILGEPGSGKTTTLLDLARTLLERAGNDKRERVPVILNLSSWKKEQPLVEWIYGELSEKYRVPRKIASSWLQNNYLLPLLDGLDEVETTLQPDCVTAINAFGEKFNPSGLVVCCRLNEYRWLPERLKLNGAICLEPLSRDEVSKYIASGGPKLAALSEAINTDPVLRELTQTPLMLSIMSLAFQGADGNELARQKGDSPEERRKQIFRLYVEQMFQRKGRASLVFPKEKTIGWLSWLAGKMKEHSQSVFIVEGIQPSWLGTRTNRCAYGVIVALSVALIAGPMHGLAHLADSSPVSALMFGLRWGLSILVALGLGCWTGSPLINGLLSGVVFAITQSMLKGQWLPGLNIKLWDPLTTGIIAGFIAAFGFGSLKYIPSIEIVSWKWKKFWKQTLVGSVVGLIFGIAFWLIFEFSGHAILPNVVPPWVHTVSVACAFALIFGSIFGIVGGYSDRIDESKATPNQGIKLSLRNSLAVFLLTLFIFEILSCFVGVLFAALLSNLSRSIPLNEVNQFKHEVVQQLGEALSDDQKRWLTEIFEGEPITTLTLVMLGNLDLALIIALIGALNRGGSAVIKHYGVRLVLCGKSFSPLNLVAFLDHCAKLIFLKNVGGGYIFIHRMLLEYFADLPRTEKSGESKRG